MGKGKTVQRYVSVFNEETGESETLAPGMKVPDYAKDQVTNPKVFEKPDGSENEAPVNEGMAPDVDPATQQGGAASDSGPTEPTDPGEVNETPNANPAQRRTAGEPGGNQAPDDGGVAPADDPDNPASSVAGGTSEGAGVDVKSLKGAELNQALEDAGLSKSGSADEKRARLAAHHGA